MVAAGRETGGDFEIGPVNYVTAGAAVFARLS
jgi:hypothetical protein